MPIFGILTAARLLSLSDALLRSTGPAVKVSSTVGEAGKCDIKVAKELEPFTALPDKR